jgi:hypothetical protein
MASWKKAGKDVRSIIFECLNRPEAKNNYFNPVQCAELCNLAAGLDFCCGIDSHHIGRAFSNGGVSDYRLQFNELINGSDASHFLHVLVDHRENRHDRHTAVGCFTSEVEYIKALQRLKSDSFGIGDLNLFVLASLELRSGIITATILSSPLLLSLENVLAIRDRTMKL